MMEVSHHCGDCCRIMLIMSSVAFYLTALILSQTRPINMFVILSFRNRELLMTLPKSSIILHFVLQLSVVNWLVNGPKIFCSIVSLESFFVINSKFLMMPKAKSLLFMKVKMIGKSSSFMIEAEHTSIMLTMLSDISCFT